MSWIGIDIGGTAIKACSLNNDGKIEKELTEPTPNELKTFIKKISQIYTRLSFLEKPCGVGIGIAGFIDMKEWVLRCSPNIKFLNEIKLFEIFNECIDTPFTVDNDANMAAWGEFKIGAGMGFKNIFHVTLGTGVGSGIILEGKLFHGSSGFGAEFGHTVVNPDGYSCNCGGKGCLETEVSASKIVRNYLELIGKSYDITSEEVYKLAKKGDIKASEAFRKAGYYLGIGLSNIINLLDPELIVLGGGVMSAGELIMKPVVEEIEKRAIIFSYKKTKIVPALLGNKAGMIGAGLWAKENLNGK